MKTLKRLFTPGKAVMTAKQRRERATAARKLRAAQRDRLVALGSNALIHPYSAFQYRR